MPEQKPFYLKHIGFVGRFKGGAKSLKDLVYTADGAPVDSISSFTNYIVVGEGGKETNGYKKIETGIAMGYNIALTTEQLLDIVEGRLALPMPNPIQSSDQIVFTTPQAKENNRQNELFLWQSKRDMYIERYGIPITDNIRFKMNVRAAKAIERIYETKLISIRDNQGYLDRAVNYFTTKWGISQVVYHDCISNSLKTESSLPRWYLLVNNFDDIVGSFGLITNDFISRQDLWPWLCALYVDEHYRGHAFGAKMLEHSKRETKQLGFGKLYLSTEHTEYYEKYGWSYIGDGFNAKGEPSRIYEINID